MNTATEKNTAEINVINANTLLEHWQGHRRLSRKTIERYPEDKLFTHSIGGMRPFFMLVMEMLDLAGDGINGLVSGNWKPIGELDHTAGKNLPATKEELLERWDEITERLNTLWPKLSSERFTATEKAFGMYEAINYDTILYLIDNEIHHRGQGFVYLRSLGIEPPAFWDRY